jgi:glycosyltransferase involved in cell wall biosynthesis
MNRLVCTNLEPATELPPAQRRGPARVLFVHGLQLGFGTVAGMLEESTADRHDIDAVHLRLVPPLWMRVAGAHNARLPVVGGTLPLSGPRMTLAYRRFLRPLIGGRFPLDRFDCVHIMTQQRALLVPELAGRSPTKFVVNMDATAAAWRREFGGTAWPLDPERRLERRIFRAADAIACWSRWSAGSLEEDYGIERSKMFMYRPCVRSTPPPGGAREPGPVRIIFIGNDWVRKGGPRLLEWHQRHWRDEAEVHVCSSAAPAERLTNVVFHGATPHAKLIREILPRMDLCVIPTWRDTLLIAAQEAQAYGLPVVSSRMAGIPDIVRHGETGYLLEAGDADGFVAAVGSLIRDSALRARMAAATRAHAAANLSHEIWHRHLVDQIIAVADGRAPAFAPAGVQ